MLEVHGDFWSYGPVDARCITTNGHVTAAGNAVMGRGVARQAKDRYPGIHMVLGPMLRQYGHHVLEVLPAVAPGKGWGRPALLSYPVKPHITSTCAPSTPCWRNNASLDLIIRSAYELVELTDARRWSRVLLPRPGCGAGGLDWDVVQWPLSVILDYRFHVIDW
jgi:hypothetical protein